MPTAARPASYVSFTRDEWAQLRAATPLDAHRRGSGPAARGQRHVSLDEVRDIYLPLSRLLNLYVGAAQGLHVVADLFLGQPASSVPYIVGIGGSVAAD